VGDNDGGDLQYLKVSVHKYVVSSHAQNPEILYSIRRMQNCDLPELRNLLEASRDESWSPPSSEILVEHSSFFKPTVITYKSYLSSPWPVRSKVTFNPEDHPLH
jgi:hypothetical protein